MPDWINNAIFAILGAILSFVPQEIARRNQNRQERRRLLLQHDLKKLEALEDYLVKLSAITKEDHPYYGDFGKTFRDPEFDIGQILSLSFVGYKNLNEKLGQVVAQAMLLGHMLPKLEPKDEEWEKKHWDAVVHFRTACEEVLKEYRKAFMTEF
jgi:hypothetical protein